MNFFKPNQSTAAPTTPTFPQSEKIPNKTLDDDDELADADAELEDDFDNRSVSPIERLVFRDQRIQECAYYIWKNTGCTNSEQNYYQALQEELADSSSSDKVSNK